MSAAGTFVMNTKLSACPVLDPNGKAKYKRYFSRCSAKNTWSQYSKEWTTIYAWVNLLLLYCRNIYYFKECSEKVVATLKVNALDFNFELLKTEDKPTD